MIRDYFKKIAWVSLFGFIVTSVLFSSTAFSAYDDSYYFEQLSAGRYPRVANDITGTLIANQFHLPVLAGAVSPTPVIKFNFNTTGIYFKVYEGTPLPVGLSMDTRGMISGNIHPDLGGTTHSFLLEMRSLDQETLYAAGFVLIEIKDVCIPTIRYPAFDQNYINETKANRNFTPSLPITPFDNFYIDFEFKVGCPASRIAEMTPSLNLTISDDLSKTLKTGSLTRQGSTNTYRWSLVGWPNGIISNQATLVELLEHSAYSLPATIEIEQVGIIKPHATKDIIMSSCVQVQGYQGSGQIPIVVMSAERFGEVGVADRRYEGQGLISKTIDTGGKLFTIDPIKKYKDKFVLYADLKPTSFNDDWLPLVYSTTNSAPKHVMSVPNKVSGCKVDPKTYIVLGGKILGNIFGMPGGTSLDGGAGLPNMAVASEPSSSLVNTILHEFLHSFASLEDEYVRSDGGYGSEEMAKRASLRNCTKDTASRYSYNGKMYGNTDEFGCAYRDDVNKPSYTSVMRDTSILKLNKISCAFVIERIKGGDPKTYYPECAGLDVIDPGENLPGVPITILTQQTNEVWLSGNSYEVRWSMPAGYSPVGAQEMEISFVDNDGLVKYRYYEELKDISGINFKWEIFINDSLFVTVPPGEYSIRLKLLPKQNGIGTGVSVGKVTLKRAVPPPVITPPTTTQSATPGQPTTINGSGFTPTGNKVQLIKTGGVSSSSLFDKFKNFAVAITRNTRNSANIANILSGTVAQAVIATDATNTYEIKDIPSNGTSLTFTIPSDIPPGVYTMKVAGLNSNYSEGVTITIASPKVAPCGTVGDLNNDRLITQADHDLLMQVIGGNTTLTPALLIASDLNNDGGVFVTDGTMLLRFLSGVITTFPACSSVPAPVITSFNRTSSIANSWVIAQGSGFSTSTTINTDKVEFSNGTQTVEAITGISASPTGDFYVEPSLPNLTFGNYSAFKIPITLAPGLYAVKIARQNGTWSNSLNYTVLPAQNPDGSYNFAHVIAMQSPPDVVYQDPRQNYVIVSDPEDETEQVTPTPRTTLIAQLLALIEQLTAQLEALKAGKTEIPKTPAPVITSTPLPNVFPTITTVACTQEVNQCPDGSFVGRTPPTCTFQACPTTTLPPAPVFACPTDTQTCANGTTVTRTLPTCLFPACPNPFTPPPPVVVTPPPPTITPVVVTPPPPTVTPPPTPTPTEPALSASLSSVYEDRAGQWGNFAPGTNSNNKANDFVWNATLTLSGSKTIRAININHNASGEYWSTDNGNAYPLVIFHNNTQLNTAYTQTLGTYGAGANNLVIYGQFENPTFSGGTLTISFTDNTSVTATIPASSFSPCTDCGQTGAVWEAVGEVWNAFWALVAW